jgi:UPF0716 protein FxsA
LFRLLFLIFLIVPIVEIYVLIVVGSHVGALATVALVVFTAVMGAALMRAQGFATIARVQSELGAGEIPALTLVEGAFILVAGALLLTPGFTFLVPPWRRALAGTLAGKVASASFQPPGAGFRGQAGARAAPDTSTRGSVIDGEFTEVYDPFKGEATDNQGRSRGQLEPPE